MKYQLRNDMQTENYLCILLLGGSQFIKSTISIVIVGQLIQMHHIVK